MKIQLKKLLAGVLSATILTSSFAVFAADDVMLADNTDTNLTLYHPDTKLELPDETITEEIPVSDDISETDGTTVPDLSVWDIPEPTIQLFSSDTVIDSGKCGDNLTWTLDSDGTLTISGTGHMYDYFNNQINGIDITTAPWGEYSDQLTRLNFEYGITRIGRSAFYNCSGLTGDLIIPDSITSIEGSAFYNCSGLTGDLIIPDNVTSIGRSAFSHCSGFTGDLIIPDSITSISNGAFSDCSGFTGNLIIPDSVTSIEDCAFSDCSNLTGNLIFPDSITLISNGAFDGCSGFTGDLIIPDSVTSIGVAVFSGCIGLSGNLVIPDSVTSIGVCAFDSCIGFTGDLIIPDSVTSIGGGAFSGCNGITDMYIARTEDSITTGAFPNRVHWAYDLSQCTARIDKEYSYNGEAIIPTEGDITVTSPNGKTLYYGTDYIITGADNNNAVGTATAFIGKPDGGISYNTQSTPFTIKDFDPGYGITDPIPIDAEKIESTISGTFVFNGKEHTPTPTFVYHFVNEKTGVAIDYDMVEGEDYEIVSYTNNVNVGIARIKVRGIGSFKDETTVVFQIAPCDISALTIADIESIEYCKKDICPEPEIKIDDIVLTNGVDYELSYENNRNRGIATVTVTGKGNVSGTTTTNFEITPRDGSKFTIIIWLG